MIWLNNFFEYIFLKINLIIFKNHQIINNNSLLFISLTGLGDFIVAHLIFENSHLFQHYNTFFLYDDEYGKLLKNYDGKIKLYPISRRKYKFNLFYRFKIILDIRKLKLSKVINLNKGRRFIDDQLTLLSGGKEKIALSFCGKNFKKYFKNSVDKHYSIILNLADENEVTKYIKLFSQFGNNTVSDITKLYFKRTDSLKLIQESNKYIVINPFSSFRFREWPSENYNNLIDWILMNFTFNIVLIGTSKKYKYNFNNSRLIDLINKTSVDEAAAIIENSIVFIGNDSSLAHIAKALGIKRIILLGGGSYSHYFPYGNNSNEYLLFDKMDCFGCEWNCKYKIPLCLTNVSVDTVKKSFNQLVSN